MESVIDQYIKTVKPMHFAFVKPTKRYADIIIPNDYANDVAVDIIIAKNIVYHSSLNYDIIISNRDRRL
jgi:uridine kinase